MSPTKFHQRQNNINGPRPCPLRLNKESHPIHKASSSSSFSSFSTSITASQQQQRKKNHPVIIYTQSPKVIHTQARDFMALVQKLTGFSRSIDTNLNEALASTQAREIVDPTKVSVFKKGNVNDFDINDEESSCLDLIEENSSGKRGDHDGDGDGDDKGRGSGVDNKLQNFNSSSKSFLADIPLFTPTSTHLFFSPGTIDRYPASVYVSPKMGNPISPSVYEFIKGLPEY